MSYELYGGRMIRRGTGALGLGLAATLVVACGGGGGSAGGGGEAGMPEIVASTPPATQQIDEVTWNLPYGEPSSLDPNKAWALPENSVLSNVCDGLLRFGPDFDYQPGLATSVEQTGPTTYLIKLREGVRFSNGDPMTVEDVLFSIQRHIDDPSDFYAIYSNKIASVTQTGPMEITLETNTPWYTDKTLNEGIGTVIQKKFAEQAGDAFGTAEGGLMCTGPFQLEKWVPGQEIVLTPNPHYWDTEHAPKAKRFVFKFVTDSAAAINGLLSGELDGSYEIPSESIAPLENSGVGTISYGESWIQNVLVINGDEGPIGNADVRKAISMALDRTGMIATAFAGAAEPAKWGSPSSQWGTVPEVYQEVYDSLPDNSVPRVEEAKALIEAAGMTGQTITVGVLSSSPASVSIGTATVDAIDKIGMKGVLKQMPASQYNAVWFDEKARGDLDILVSVGGAAYFDVGDPLQDLTFNKTCDAPFNVANTCIPELDVLVEQGLATTDPKQRAELTAEALRISAEDATRIPLVFAPEVLFMNKRITGAPTGFPVFMFYPWAADVGGV